MHQLRQEVVRKGAQSLQRCGTHGNGVKVAEGCATRHPAIADENFVRVLGDALARLLALPAARGSGAVAAGAAAAGFASRPAVAPSASALSSAFSSAAGGAASSSSSPCFSPSFAFFFLSFFFQF